MASGQQERALEGFYRWLNDGGRDYLSNFTQARTKRKKGIVPSSH
jgi:hypothetical protein